MGASKANWVHQVHRLDSGVIIVSVSEGKDTPDSRWCQLSLGSLTRNDLRRTCAYLGLSGAKERSNDEMARDIATFCEGKVGDINPRWSASAPSVPAPVAPTPSVSAPAVAVASAPAPSVSSGSSLDGVIAEIARITAEQVVDGRLAAWEPLDADKVGEMVASAVAEMVARPVVTNVTVGSCPTVTLQGREHFQLQDVLAHIACGDELYLWGGAGAGKTTTVKRCAEILGRRFELVTFSSQTTEAKLVGFRDATGEVRRTPLVDALLTGGVVLFDEFDSCPPSVAVTINSVSANRMVSTPDGTYDLHPDTVLVFSGNTPLDGATTAYNGRQAADFSTKDRMSVVQFLYDLELERDLTIQALGGDATTAERWLRVVRSCRANAESLGGATSARIAVTPRAAIGGAKLLRQGMSLQYVANARIRKGMDDRTWDQVRVGIPELAV